MKVIIFLSLINTLLFILANQNDIEIYRLNEIGESQALEIEDNQPFYFFSPISDINTNEAISYLISKEIKKFTIGYIFLESDKYEDINKDNIQKYSYNETSGYLDFDKYFKTIYKTKDNQKGLLFKLNITENEESIKNFTMTRINLTVINSLNSTILIKDQFNYFYLNIISCLNQYDIFVFSSNAKNRIEYYSIYNKEIHYYESTERYFFYDQNYDNNKYIYHIEKNNEDEIYFNIKSFKKKIFIKSPIFGGESGEYQIELCFPNSSLNEIYFFKTNILNGISIFYKELFGKIDAYYIKFSEISNLDDILNKTIEKMHILKDIAKIERDEIVLIYFKCKDNLPSIFEFYHLATYVTQGIIEKGVTYHYLTKPETYTPEIPIRTDLLNISISFEYLGCELEDGDSIELSFGDNKLILNKTLQKYSFSNINITKGKYFIYSNKLCCLSIKLDEYKEKIYSLDEYNNRQINISDRIFFKYPKITEDNHYLLEFYEQDSNRVYNPTCIAYYDDLKKFVLKSYLNVGPSFTGDYTIKDNPYKIFENGTNLTYIILCHSYYANTNLTVNIKSLKKETGILNKVFYVNNYTEYIFPAIWNKSLISIQTFDYKFTSSVEPFLSISNYGRYITYESEIFRGNIGEIPKLFIDKKEYYMIVNYIDYLYEFNYDLHVSSFNISFDGKNTLTFSIIPFIKNEPIKYIIHIYKGSMNLGKQNKYENLVENFGEITINQSFIKTESNIFEYKYIIGKIDVSYKNFVIVGKGMNSGYIYYYNSQEFNLDYKPDYTLIIVLPIVIVILIGGGILAFVLIRRRKKININDNNSKEKEFLLQEKN